jgi:Sap, sulfolipid-1-addressing protein
VSSDLADIAGLALLATLNPSLLAAVTIMLLLPNPRRLMAGYLLGAYLTSITSGLVIVFSLHGSAAEDQAKRSISPAEDIVVGVVLLVVSFVLATGRDAPLQRRREARKERKEREGKGSRSERLLGRGSARVTFAVGAVLSFPGVSYFLALDHIVRLDPGAVPSILLVIGFCFMQLLFLELPLLGYLFSPEWTHRAVHGFRDFLARRGRLVATIGAAIVGLVLILRGVLNAT